MSAAEFERRYAERAGLTVERLRALGRVVMPCHCGDEICEGWVSVSREAAKDYEPGGLYNRQEATPQ
jgi:hypothetical protein